MKKSVASCVVACALGCPCLVLAQDKGTYRAEAGLDYYRADTGTGRSSGVGATGTYYFDALPGVPQDYPLDAAPFVERAASISATYARTSQDFDNFQTLSDGSSYGAGLVFRRPDLPLYVDASYRRSSGGKFRSSTGTEFESDGKSYQLAAGGYLGKTTLLVLDWQRSTSQSNNILSSGNILLERVNVGIGLGATHLARLSNGDHLALAVRASQTKQEADGQQSEKNNTLFLAGTYYPTKRLGLNLGYGYDRGDARFSEGDTWAAGLSWFVTAIVRLSFGVQRFSAKAPNSDYDLVSLGALVRF